MRRQICFISPAGRAGTYLEKVDHGLVSTRRGKYRSWKGISVVIGLIWCDQTCQWKNPNNWCLEISGGWVVEG